VIIVRRAAGNDVEAMSVETAYASYRACGREVL
jgi:hypothetical protein